MKQYTDQLVQELKPTDHPMRFCFAKWACDQLTEDAQYGKKKIISDKANLDFSGYVNKQHCRIWSTENPHAYVEKPTHPNESLFGAEFSPEA